MEFSIKNVSFMKSNNNNDKIFLINVATLMPFLIYKCYINGLNSIIICILSIISSFLSSLLYNYIVGHEHKISVYYKELIYSIIITFILPINTPYLLLFIVNIVIILLSKYINMINIYLISTTLIYYVILSTNNTLQFLDYNIYIFSLMLIISLLTLIDMRSIKFRISLFYILTIIIKLLITRNILPVDYVLLFSGVFVIPEFKSTPNTAFIQIIFAVSVGIISIIFSIEYLFVLVIVLNIIFKYIDKYYSYFLAKQ